MRRILVCGGQRFGEMPKGYDRKDEIRLRRRMDAERRFFIVKMDEHLNVSDDNMLGDECTIIHGNASGADSLADDYAVVNWKEVQVFPADWAKHKKSAGYIRNAQMLKEGKPTEGVAFPGNNGTANMVKLMEKAGIPVTKFTVEDVDNFIASRRR